jgi:3-oxoacyl-[acyl-carrier-protein] synthase II
MGRTSNVIDSNRKRIVVTGLGAITPIGNSAPDFWEGLKTGRSGAATITRFDPEPYATRFACEVKGFDPMDHMDRKQANRLDPFGRFALAAAREALADAGIDPAHLPESERERCGVVIGNGIGGFQSVESQLDTFFEAGPRRVSPLYIPLIIPNMPSGALAIDFGFKGPSHSVASACATGNNSLFDAWALLQLGHADLMIAGSAEACITPSLVAGFNAVKALSTRNDSPETASRPFDLERDGFIMGEGAGILIMETYEHAVRRGARIRAEVRGFGLSSDAYHITAPDPTGRGAARAMREMLQRAGLQPEDIDYINMHGTSTRLGDIAETQAVKAVFGEHAYRLKLSSSKSMTGHMISAAAAAEAVATVLALEHQCIPPTINFSTPDPECDLDYTFNTACPAPVRAAISNSFGFGGHNTCVAFSGPTG